MAGLLTYSHSEAFPVIDQWLSFFRMLNRASQQRDCSGFAPYSLLICFYEKEKQNQFGGKYRDKF